MGFISPVLGFDITSVRKTKETGKVLTENVWHILPPGEIVVAKFHGVEVAARDVGYDEIEQYNRPASWAVNVEFMDWNGAQGGYHTARINIPGFEGYKLVTDLEVYPSSFCPDCNEIKQRFTARGRQVKRLRGYHYQHYSGSIILLNGARKRQNTLAFSAIAPWHQKKLFNIQGSICTGKVCY